MEAGGHVGDLVAVAHPHVEAEDAIVVHMVFDTVQQAGLAHHVDAGIAKFAQVGALYLAAQLLGHGLHAVADAEQRHLELEHGLRCARAVGFVNRLRTTGKDDAARGEGADRLVTHVERVDLAVHADLAHAAGDQLGVLGTEIEDQDSVGVNVLGHGHLSLRNSQTTRG
ncbi:hypothetical protein D9M71_553070 [compost metagenome]